ncbi:MAG: hypothetical protein HOV80_10850 [Polyangiaceae bacterium]|nr:hypothetical protein [Polyangiaceae bacterium]
MSNPFATRWIRPGATPYLFANGGPTLDALVRHVRAGKSLEIVGPHGSGKSTLIEALLAALSAAEIPWRASSLHDGGMARRTRSSAGVGARVHSIDGFEQLSWAERAAVRLRARVLAHGLIVTAHAPVGMDLVLRTEVTPDLAVAVVTRLLERAPPQALVRPTDVLPRLRAHAGNLREALFDLYDAYQPALSRNCRPGQ